MKKCPYCGHNNNDQAKNCEKCYAEIPVKEPEKSKKDEKKTVKE